MLMKIFIIPTKKSNHWVSHLSRSNKPFEKRRNYSGRQLKTTSNQLCCILYMYRNQTRPHEYWNRCQTCISKPDWIGKLLSNVNPQSEILLPGRRLRAIHAAHTDHLFAFVRNLSDHYPTWQKAFMEKFWNQKGY